MKTSLRYFNKTLLVEQVREARVLNVDEVIYDVVNPRRILFPYKISPAENIPP